MAWDMWPSDTLPEWAWLPDTTAWARPGSLGDPRHVVPETVPPRDPGGTSRCMPPRA
jgi:hypothetical protein